jgi:hypothetical protein
MSFPWHSKLANCTDAEVIYENFESQQCVLFLNCTPEGKKKYKHLFPQNWRLQLLFTVSVVAMFLILGARKLFPSVVAVCFYCLYFHALIYMCTRLLLKK